MVFIAAILQPKISSLLGVFGLFLVSFTAFFGWALWGAIYSLFKRALDREYKSKIITKADAFCIIYFWLFFNLGAVSFPHYISGLFMSMAFFEFLYHAHKTIQN
jgi:hypothetical protein